MVRAGRRVRTLVASAKAADGCDSPKRKDQRLDFSGKLSHISPSVKNQTITDFFHAVQEQDAKIQLVENELDVCPISPRTNQDKNNANKELFEATIPEQNLLVLEQPTSTTPHRIELYLEQSSPTNTLSQLHISLGSKKPVAPKARRRLNINQTQNQVLRQTSKDDKLNNKNATTNSHTITEYFPVRRSVRKTKRTVLEEKQKTLEQCVRNEIEEGLEIHNFPGKGRGIVACQTFLKGDFVVEYRGELIDLSEAKKREVKYAQDQNTGCYMYYFKHKNMQYCVDATKESGYLGRLVNHSRNGNLVTRTVMIDGIPRLVLIAKDDIMHGEEVTYDYGDRSKESLKYHPWLAS